MYTWSSVVPWGDVMSCMIRAFCAHSSFQFLMASNIGAKASKGATVKAPAANAKASAKAAAVAKEPL